MGGVPRRLHRDPPPHRRGSSPAARRTTRRSTSPAASCCRTRPATRRTFDTDVGRAMFSVSPTDVLHVPEGRLLLQTLRSHDQFNTTIYGLDDRYRGMKGGRRVVFVHPDDIAALGLDRRWPRRPGQRVGGRRAPGPGVPRRRLRPAARVRRGLLPRDQPADRRSTTWPRAATARRRSRWWCGWSPRSRAPRRPTTASIRSDEGTREGSPAGTDTNEPRSPSSSPDDQPRARPRRAGPRPVRGRRRRRGAAAARGAAGRAARDARTTHAPAAAPLADRRVVLRRPLRARPRRRHRRHGGGAAPAHRAADRELAVHRRGRAPRQRRPPRDGAARRGQPDDRRSRHQPLRGVDARHRRPPRGPALGRAARRRRATSSRGSTTTPPSRCAATAGRRGSSSARCSGRPRRCRPTRRCSAPSCCSTPARRSTSTSTPASSTASSSTPASSPSTATEVKQGDLGYAAPGRTTLRLVAGAEPVAAAAARRAAVRRVDRHVVELRRPHPRGGRRLPRGVAAPDHPRRRGRRRQPDRRRRPVRRGRPPAAADPRPAACRTRGCASAADVAGPVTGDDGVARCPWGAGDPLLRDYHDTEWGVPISGEAAHLERLTLEAFQSGLSWRTILAKRDDFREAFAGFDADAVAAYGDADRARLMADAGIVRNRLKVDAAITNAAATVALRDAGGLEAFVARLPARRAAGARDDRGGGDHLAGVRRAVEGAEEAGLRLRRPDHDVRADGGDRPGRRPPRGLPPPRVSTASRIASPRMTHGARLHRRRPRRPRRGRAGRGSSERRRGVDPRGRRAPRSPATEAVEPTALNARRVRRLRPGPRARRPTPARRLLRRRPDVRQGQRRRRRACRPSRAPTRSTPRPRAGRRRLRPDVPRAPA